jgi:predicted outer membrane protein
MTTLATLTGATFDKAYLQHEAAFHRQRSTRFEKSFSPRRQVPP